MRAEERYLAWTCEFCEGKEFPEMGREGIAGELANSGTGGEHGCSDTVEHMFELRDNDRTLKFSRRLWGNFDDVVACC